MNLKKEKDNVYKFIRVEHISVNKSDKPKFNWKKKRSLLIIKKKKIVNMCENTLLKTSVKRLNAMIKIDFLYFLKTQ